MNNLSSILTELESQLEGIDGTQGSYNFVLQPEQVLQGFIPMDKADVYPFICIPYVNLPPSKQTDQVTYECPLDVEIYGYVKTESNVLVEAAKLQSDIEAAIYTDESLGGYVWEMQLRAELVTSDDCGAVVMVLSAKTEFIKS